MTPAALASQVTQSILVDLASCDRGVVVDSPPGAGKSTLVVRAASELVSAGERLIVVAQTNEQTDDLIGRFAAVAPEVRLGRLSARDYRPPDRLSYYTNVHIGSSVTDLTPCRVFFATAAKVARLMSTDHWPWAIIDEAYQMRSDLLLQIAPRFTRALFVGDPGQLDPFSAVETDRWAGQSWDPTLSAVAVLLRHNPDIPVHQLPLSWRLPASATASISEAFYPFTGFHSAAAEEQRRISFTTRALGNSAIDATIELAGAAGWALHELPARHSPQTDAEVAIVCAEIAVRVLQRGTVVHSEDDRDGGTALTSDRIAIGAAHRMQVAAIRSALGGRASGIVVDTANRLQGREFDLTVVWHPLSGRRDATAFHLESGRLCVLTSRHRHACIVVARAGIPELLDAHPSTEPVHLNVPAKFPDGWEANQSMMAHLLKHHVRA